LSAGGVTAAGVDTDMGVRSLSAALAVGKSAACRFAEESPAAAAELPVSRSRANSETAPTASTVINKHVANSRLVIVEMG
jgi:hypothetical protein